MTIELMVKVNQSTRRKSGGTGVGAGAGALPLGLTAAAAPLLGSGPLLSDGFCFSALISNNDKPVPLAADKEPILQLKAPRYVDTKVPLVLGQFSADKRLNQGNLASYFDPSGKLQFN